MILSLTFGGICMKKLKVLIITILLFTLAYTIGFYIMRKHIESHPFIPEGDKSIYFLDASFNFSIVFEIHLSTCFAQDL